MPELLTALAAFMQEHRRCGELESDISEGEPSWIVMVCSCGGQITRRVGEESLVRMIGWGQPRQVLKIVNWCGPLPGLRGVA